jgi:hypothetical protein
MVWVIFVTDSYSAYGQSTLVEVQRYIVMPSPENLSPENLPKLFPRYSCHLIFVCHVHGAARCGAFLCRAIIQCSFLVRSMRVAYAKDLTLSVKPRSSPHFQTLARSLQNTR